MRFPVVSTSFFDSGGGAPDNSFSSEDEGNNTPHIEQLDRYLAGESSPAETRTIRAWLDQFPESEQAMGSLRQMRLAMPEDWDPHAAWSETEQRLLQESETSASRSFAHFFPRTSEFSDVQKAKHELALSPQKLLALSSPKDTFGKPVTVSHWVSRVIGVGLAASLIWGFVYFGNAIKGSSDSTRAFAVYPSTYTTGNGERGTITLPDSTVVVLNVGSRLEVASDFARGHRVVRVEGEAFFAVTHHQKSPFVVKAGNTSTRVLGTSFIVRKYPEDTVALVAVRDGKVMVESAVVTANEEVRATLGVTSPVTTASARRFTFTQGILSLGETSLVEAIPQLNRWYNVDIRLGDPMLAARRIEGQFAAGSLTDLAENLEWVFNLAVVRDGRTLTLYSK